MWAGKTHGDLRKDGGNGLVALAIDKDKNSQAALKWTVDHLLHKGQTLILIHVKLKHIHHHSGSHHASAGKDHEENAKEIFLPFRCFCTRRDIQCKDVLMEDTDVARALIQYVSQATIENLVIGACSKSGFLRFKATDIPGNVTKGAPDFCTVYVISRGKISTVRSASRAAPTSPHRPHLSLSGHKSHHTLAQSANSIRGSDRQSSIEVSRNSTDEVSDFRSPFTRKGYAKSHGEISAPETDISFVSSGRSSIDRIFFHSHSGHDPSRTPPRFSGSSEFNGLNSPESISLGRNSMDINSSLEFSLNSMEGDRTSSASQTLDDLEVEMRRLKQELKHTMEMYSTACKEALTAKQQAMEIQRWKLEEERRLEEARLAEEHAMAIVEREKAKSKAAMEAAEAAQRLAELEAQKRMEAEKKALREAEERRKVLNALHYSEVRYRKYSIDEIEAATEFFSDKYKIGEGGYGPVYKCYLDHTPVAVKVLRPDAAQGRSQFQQEVEVLSCIRHPNMVLLLGACPEYGCLVYEFMANGSLEDCLFKNSSAPPLSWQTRFRIAAEIGTALLFLHQTKPEPLVHRDLKPANILLDRNYVSKISDVGLSRLVPPSVADSVTQYRMTSTAGTFCYIDPEYQQTGMLGVKSDIYSLGIMFLQMITAKPPMGLTHHVERAIEKGTFSKLLDPSVPDWPLEEALAFTKMALRCAELRRKDRPDLGTQVLPLLERFRALAEDAMESSSSPSPDTSKSSSQVSLQLDQINDIQPPVSQ